MQQPLNIRLLVVALLLSNATGIAQPNPGEFGRGFPYSSGGDLKDCLGPVIFLVILFMLLGLAGQIKDKLEDQPRWHTVLVAVATLLLAVFLMAKVTDAAFIVFVFALLPSFIVVGVLYLLVLWLFRIK
jgi:hypothetical protein